MSDHVTLRAPADLEELKTRASMERAEWRRLLAASEARAARARSRLDDARETLRATGSPTARWHLARATRAHQVAERDVLLLLTIWDTTGRVGAIARLQLDETDWIEEGAVVLLHDKGTGDGPRARPGFLVAATAARLRAWRASIAPDGELPRVGPFWPGAHGRALTPEAIETAVHNLALDAGVQRYLPGGRTKQTHRFLVTTNAIRELAEDVAIERGCSPDIAARAAGHTLRTAHKHYRQAGADHARAAALARAARG